MSERSNYGGHYGTQQETRAPHPHGIVFRKEGSARFSPYMWLSYAEIEVGRQIKLDFGHYDVVVRSRSPGLLQSTFEEISRHDCREIVENAGVSIEIIEKGGEDE